MSKIFKLNCVLFLTTTLLVACGGSSGGSNNKDPNDPNNKSIPANRVNWSAVPPEFNPSTDDIEFRTEGLEKINVDASGFKDDAEVIYSPDVAAGKGFLRLFKVYKDSASWGSLQPRANGTKLDLVNYGTYQCSIRIVNGQIEGLKGGCFVRLQVFLPVGSEIEVYNVGQLLTKRFIPIKTEEFLEQLDDATWAADKFAVIENFLTSYNGMSKTPSMTSQQLGEALGEFSFKEEKFKALGRLHPIVSDRENLGRLIEDKFSFFEREEARRIVGL